MTGPQLAVVTGGAGGIGSAICMRLAADGWHVVMADGDEAAARRTSAQSQSGGPAIAVHALDVTSETAVAQFAGALLAEAGVPSLLVNAAGLLENATSVDALDLATYDEILSVNLRGVLLVSRSIGRAMCQTGSGSIVNLCSIASFRTSPQPAYALSKVGLKALTETMAAEYGPQGVRVNAVAPGYTMTPVLRRLVNEGRRDPASAVARSALRRLVEPGEVADAVAFLASPAAAAITGVTLPVDCGWLVGSAYSSFATT